jgi:hypothetical protein
MRKGFTALAVLALTAALLAGGATAANAWSASTNYNYPGGRYLQANVWLSNGNPFNWQTSTKYLGSGSGPSTASSIKNVASIGVTGIGVSLGNFSGGTSSDQDFSASWTNSNTWIADLAGANSTSNLLYLYVTGGSSGNATIPYFGSPRSVSASVQKFA